jgi:hypothetical protein
MRAVALCGTVSGIASTVGEGWARFTNAAGLDCETARRDHEQHGQEHIELAGRVGVVRLMNGKQAFRHSHIHANKAGRPSRELDCVATSTPGTAVRPKGCTGAAMGVEPDH